MLKDRDLESKTLLPLVDHGSFEAAPLELRSCRRRTKQELWKVLQRLPDVEVSFTKVSRAYDRALALYREGRERLRQVYPGTLPGNGEIQVVLAGRPYQVLAAEMNKGIPDIFASLGIKTYYQDMLPPLFDHPSTERSSASSIPADGTAAEIRQALKAVRSLLDAVHWHYAARILETAAYCAVSEGLYPVLITAFKCSPDSIIIEYFKRILDSRGKPYLILQIDEHDSSVGYETRIEAGIHSFRNHASRLHTHGVAAGAAQRPVSPRLEQSLRGRTLLLPNWDSLTVPILAAALRSAGVDARALEEDNLTIQEGSRFNSGQCLPINAIVQSLVRYVRKHRLDPARTHLWMMKSDWACNLHLFPHYMKSLLERYGGGLEQVGIYLGDLSHTEIAPRLGIDAYFAYLFGGLLRRLGCRIRPYETDPGRTDRTIAAAQAIFIDSFDSSPGNRSREDALATVIRMFSEIPRSEGMRPKVAIFGDFYVRDNEVMNQDLIRFIESQGAEVVTTPFSEYLRITASAVFKRWMREQHYLRLAKYRGLLALVKMLENRFFSDFQELIDPGTPFRDAHPEQKLGRFNVRLEHHGESWDNLLKIAHLVEVHPDLRLFVQTNPAFCCPSLVTEAMTQRIEELTGVPVVTLTYDGTGSFKNDRIVPYLAGLNGSPGEVAVPEILRATR
jgi:predicted nucleotide-binding protein (sugar kinase/HSP70/actin superfamily)